MRFSTIAIAACMITVGANASELADAFANGKVKGEIKALYVTTNNNDVTGGMTRSDQSALSVGGELGYTTDYFRGAKLGVTAQTSHNIDIGGDEDLRSAYSTTNLSEAYLEYKFNDKTSFKGGRQYMYTPLIFTANKAWLTKESFETYNFKTTAIPNTTILGGVMTKYLQRDAEVDTSDTISFHDPIYHIFAKNKSIKGLTLTGQALYMDGEHTALSTKGPYPIAEQNFLYTFGKIDYALPISLPISLRASYYNLNYDTAQDADKYILGASVKLGNFKVDFDYGKVSDEASTLGVIGDTPSLDAFTMQSTDASFKGMESWATKLHVNMKGFGFDNFERLTLAHGDFDSDIIGRKYQNTTIDVQYKLDGLMKGLWTRTRFANIHWDQNGFADMDENQQEIRISAVYKF